MKILQINLTYKMGSTGKIMADLNDVLKQYGHEGYMLCGYANGGEGISNLYCFHNAHNDFYVRRDLLESRITGRMGYSKKHQTKKAIQWIEKIHPDIVHLHNIHGNWIQIFILMDYLRKNKIPVVWTLHDCWSFTGRCSHFSMVNCEKWKSGCYKCNNKEVYPITYFFDFCRRMWKDKKEAFSSLPSVHIVTPSKWLSQYVKDSYLKKYSVTIINNGIDIEQFCPQTIQNKYYDSLAGKKIILSVASSWSERKGLLDIYELKKYLDSKEYKIVIVGLNSRQLNEVPDGILGIGRTQNVKELASIYSGATVFVNPTYEDNYPTVNLEAIACGIPVVTYKTGGSGECVTKDTGVVVEQGDLKGMAIQVKKITENIGKYKVCCRKYAEDYFDKRTKYAEYVKLYENIINNAGR